MKYIKKTREQLIEIIGNKCAICESTEKLNITAIVGSCYSEVKSRFKSTTMMYTYYRNHPDEARKKLQLLCLLHSNEKKRQGIIKARAKQQIPKKDTSIEKAIWEGLDSLGIPFEKHKVFNIRGHSHKVDIFIKPNICINADGGQDGYWHTRINRNYYQIHRDNIIDAELEKQGQIVRRYFQEEIDDNLAWVIKQVIQIIPKDILIRYFNKKEYKPYIYTGIVHHHRKKPYFSVIDMIKNMNPSFGK